MSKLTYPCVVDVDLRLDAKSVRFIKRQSELKGECAMYGVPRAAHDKCLAHGLIEGEDFSHEPWPYQTPAVGVITYDHFGWNEQVY